MLHLVQWEFILQKNVFIFYVFRLARTHVLPYVKVPDNVTLGVLTLNPYRIRSRVGYDEGFCV